MSKENQILITIRRGEEVLTMPYVTRADTPNSAVLFYSYNGEKNPSVENTSLMNSMFNRIKELEAENAELQGAINRARQNDGKGLSTPKLAPFDLQRALAGDPVVTRDGRPVKIAGYNPKPGGPCVLLGWIDDDEYLNWYASGVVHDDKEHESDLFMAPMAPKARTVWVNLYPEEIVKHGKAVWLPTQSGADNINSLSAVSRLGGRAYPITIEE